MPARAGLPATPASPAAVDSPVLLAADAIAKTIDRLAHQIVAALPNSGAATVLLALPPPGVPLAHRIDRPTPHLAGAALCCSVGIAGAATSTVAQVLSGSLVQDTARRSDFVPLALVSLAAAQRLLSHPSAAPAIGPAGPPVPGTPVVRLFPLDSAARPAAPTPPGTALTPASTACNSGARSRGNRRGGRPSRSTSTLPASIVVTSR